MKRKKYQTGFVLTEAKCTECVFKADKNRSFFKLKDKLIEAVQDLHNQAKPVACNGNLTILFTQAVKEID